MFQRFFFAALFAGLIAGLVLTAAQAVRAIPLIHQAEVYETAAEQSHTTAHSHAGMAMDHGESEWQPAEGLERFAFTLLANLLASIGFALLLVAGYGFFGPVSWPKGLLWGLGGFAAFTLAPSIGLPPELPGTAAAELSQRQLWWISAAGGTAAGLALIAFAPRVLWKAAGAALIALPHLIGAPHPSAEAIAAPAELAHAFVAASILSNLAFWLVLGPLSAYLFVRFVQPSIKGG